MLQPDRRHWASIPSSVLNIEACLTSGQTFLWNRTEPGRCILATESFLAWLEPHDDGFWWATWPTDRWDMLERFFALDVDLARLYADWTERDPGFSAYIAACPGLRILRQNPETTLIDFVCSSCNNVERIQGMIRRLARAVGTDCACPWADSQRLHPGLTTLTLLSEDDLRKLGFGYRARYLVQLSRLGLDLTSLAALPRAEARASLVRLPGVGPKVADCIRLFGFGHDDAVPVDTHLRRYITSRLVPSLAARSMTSRTYESLADAFRGIMGPYSGWAQQYVYAFQRRTLRSPQCKER